MVEESDPVCDPIVRNREIAEDTARLAPEVGEAAGAELSLPDLVPPGHRNAHRARHVEPAQH